MTVHDVLTALPLDDLKLIAATLGLQPSLVSRARLIREIPIWMFEPGFLESCLDRLKPEEQDLLLAVLLTGDRGYSPSPHLPYERGLTDRLYTLLSHGLIVGRPGQARTPEYVAPGDIRDALTGYLNRRVASRLTASVRPPRTDETDALSFIRDLFSFLSALRVEPARLTDHEVLFKRAQEHLFDRFEVRESLPASTVRPYPDQFTLMMAYCQTRRLVYAEDSRLRCSSAFEQWLHLPTTEKLDDLLAFWYNMSQRWSPRATSLLGVLQVCLDLDGIDIESLTRLVVACTPGLPSQPAVIARERTAVIDDLRELAWLGLLRLYGGEASDPTAVAFTPCGRAVLGNRSWAEEGLWAERFIVQPNYEMIVPRTLNLAVRDELERLTDLVAVDRALTYRISKESIYRAGDDGMSGEAIVAFLRRHSEKPVPQNVEYSIREWGAHYGQVYFLDAFLLMTADADLARHIRAHPVLSSYIRGEVAPHALIVERHQCRELMDALKKAGYMPKSRVIGMEAERATVHHPFSREWFADAWSRHRPERVTSPVIGMDEGLPGVRLRQWFRSGGADAAHLQRASELQYLSPKQTQELLELAIHRDQTMLIDYSTGNRGRSALQMIRPSRIDKTRGTPYVEAYCPWDHQTRAFKIANIKAIRIADDNDER